MNYPSDSEKSVNSRVSLSQRETSLPSTPADPATRDAIQDPSWLGVKADQLLDGYRLIKHLGEGGMGTVWLAEQTTPVRRHVALKFIKLGKMLSGNNLARFEFERQTLATLCHPNIAQIYSAGATPEGLPYFAMELVQGEPLTSLCDRERLSIEQRLSLFGEICHGVQFAHQKGVIHRDLKPSNILVSRLGEKLAVKVIDFGLAKSNADLRPPELTNPFKDDQVLGTYLYMSPEQAQGGQQVDERTDIYSLGVILYELLTSSTPLNTTLRDRSSATLLSTIQEGTAQPPSARLSGCSDEEAKAIAQHRKIARSRLRRLLVDDLDWIVLKALHKDPSLRYASVSELAEDIVRFLNQEPIRVRRLDRLYNTRKFLQKYRTVVVASFAILLILLFALTFTSLSLLRARESEAAAIAAKTVASQKTSIANSALEAERKQREYAESVSSFLVNDILGMTSVKGQLEANAGAASNLSKDTSLNQLLDRAADRLATRHDLAPLVEARLKAVVGNSYVANGKPNVGLPFLLQALEISRREFGNESKLTLEFINSLGNCFNVKGSFAEALPFYEESYQIRRKLYGIASEDTLESMNNLGCIYKELGRTEEARLILTECFEFEKKYLDPSASLTLDTMNNLGVIYRNKGQFEAAREMLDQSLLLTRAKYGPKHPRTLSSINNLGACYMSLARFTDACDLYNQSLDLRVEILGADHLDTNKSRMNLASAQMQCGETQAAIEQLEQAKSSFRRTMGDDYVGTIACSGNLAVAYKRLGDFQSAAHNSEEALATARKNLGDKHPTTLALRTNLANLYGTIGQPERALRTHQGNLAIYREVLGADHPDTLFCMNSIACGYAEISNVDKAIQLLEITLEKRSKILGQHHHDTLQTQYNLACLYALRQRVDDSITMLEQVIAKAKTADLRKAALTAIRRSYARGQRKSEFEALAKPVCLELQKQSISSDNVSEVLQLAQDYLSMEDGRAAMPWIKLTLAYYSSETHDSWQKYYCLYQQGIALRLLSQPQLAEVSLEKAYSGMTRLAESLPLQDRWSRLSDTLDELIKCNEESGKRLQAAKWNLEKRILGYKQTCYLLTASSYNELSHATK